MTDDTADVAPAQPHTTEQDFRHFLSYSGLWRESAEVIALLRQAFEAGCDDDAVD